ncbi:MAG: DUF1365 domain-containing protein [Gammaproteobacteria bacterium]|nr:DUF1365 domain-containing protein [Gammaproteobacteria bacterium]
MFRSGIYRCRIAHRRSRPRRHALSYGAFYLLLDLDELDQLHRRLKWFSVNSFNLLSHFDRDHGGGSNQSLRAWVEGHLADAGVHLNGGRIEILCLPRILGYAFNPISVYYCYDADERIRAILYEVNNTFSERHTYLFTIANENANEQRLMKHDCPKRFYVSPFIGVEGRYHFRIRRPGDKIYLHIHQTDDDGPLLDAWVRGDRLPLTDRNLIATLFRYPLLSLKVIGGIHWEALKLWMKGIGLRDRPAPPKQPVTTITAEGVKPRPNP